MGVDGESYDTAAIMESLTVTIELTAAAHRVLRWWKNQCFQFPTELLGPTRRLCEAAVPAVGAVWRRTATRWDLSESDRRILLIHGQLKRRIII